MVRKEMLIIPIVLALAAMACGLFAEDPGDTVATVAKSLDAGSPDAQTGAELFSQNECTACHVKAAGVLAPPINGLYGETVTLETGETVTVDEDYLRESILTPEKKIVAGYNPIMPAFEGRISDAELAALVEYIKSLGD
jgi:cytochrome c oxidase subunit 2